MSYSRKRGVRLPAELAAGTVEPVDDNVFRLVVSWLDCFPPALNLPLKDFLKIGPMKALKYGAVFAAEHHALIGRILGAYADSVSALGGHACELGYEERCDAFVPGETDADTWRSTVLQAGPRHAKSLLASKLTHVDHDRDQRCSLTY